MPPNTKIIDTTCPGCKKEFGTAVDLEELQVSLGKFNNGHEKGDSDIRKEIAELKEMLKPKETPPAPAPEKPKKPTVKAPPHIKKAKCKNCNKLHDNENYEGPAVGKCDNCGEKFTDRTDGKCPYCKPGEIEKLDEDDRADMELFEDDPEEHEGHGHD